MTTRERSLARRIVRKLLDITVNARRGFGVPIAMDAWDRDFGAGNWAHLAGVSEMGHYLLIVGYATRLFSKPRILDVGCGDGVLRGYFAEAVSEEYIGLDISSVAIAQATAKSFPNTRFLVGSFESPPNLGLFDIVIFNECIYYAPNPLQVFNAFWQMIRPGGAIIISMHDTGVRTTAIWRRLEKRHPSSHATHLINERKQAWDIRAFIRTDVARSRVEHA